MKTSHTPGPWAVATNGYGPLTVICEGAAETTICSVSIQDPQCDGGRDGKLEHANARLIAAAPELLAALEKICERSLLIVEGAEYGTQPTYDRAECSKLARAAIAKAGGVA